MKKIIKKFPIIWRDIWNSLYLGAIVPALFAIQELLDKDADQLTWTLVVKVIVGAVVGNLIRKALEKPKVITIEPISVLKTANDKDKTNPPPLGDPTHPKKD